MPIGRKIPLINLARYTISGQSDKETESSFTYSFVRIQYQINYRSSLKYVNFIHRQGTTNCKVRGREECGASAEVTTKIISCVVVQSLMTPSLLVDLAVSDVAATVSCNLFNQCSVILCRVTQQRGQNVYGTPKMQY